MISRSFFTLEGISERGMVQFLTLMSNELPIKSPILTPRLAVYTFCIDTSSSWMRSIFSFGHSKDMSCVVIALLSFVPAKPIFSLEMNIVLARSLTSLFVSQFLDVTSAITKRPSSFCAGLLDISLTMKSSAEFFMLPPVPSVSVR